MDRSEAPGAAAQWALLPPIALLDCCRISLPPRPPTATKQIFVPTHAVFIRSISAVAGASQGACVALHACAGRA
eukprot:COSAG02_NODE_14116_length_1308_cov_1.326716_1_plen_73_part_10